ncbi:MAG: serine hydrolase domain-containing protein [Weeksellaceae bacterium]|nr:serine hydrolase domain-containing protein [Weeksellaceae bacterium]
MRLVTIMLLAAAFMQVSISCNSKEKKIEERNNLIDSILVSMQQHMYQAQIDSMAAKTGFNGVISIYHDTVEIYKLRHGFRDFPGKAAFADNTIFSIASISKQITAAMIMQLQEQGKLQVQDPVAKYLEDYNTSAKKNISIHQLLTHTSGIYDFGPGLQFQPGTDFGYSNVGYNDLGRVIEHVTGQDYDTYAQHFFQQAGLQHTRTPALLTDPNFASAYHGSVTTPILMENMPMRLAGNNIGVPAGGILSSVEDLHLWNQKLYSRQIIDSTSLSALTQVHTRRKLSVDGSVGYGYGLHISDQTPLSYYHTGYIKGAPSLNIYYPQSKTSVIILSNHADESKSKREIFRPHFQVKSWCDALQTVVPKLQEQYKHQATQ